MLILRIENMNIKEYKFSELTMATYSGMPQSLEFMHPVIC